MKKSSISNFIISTSSALGLLLGGIVYLLIKEKSEVVLLCGLLIGTAAGFLITFKTEIERNPPLFRKKPKEQEERILRRWERIEKTVFISIITIISAATVCSFLFLDVHWVYIAVGFSLLLISSYASFSVKSLVAEKEKEGKFSRNFINFKEFGISKYVLFIILRNVKTFISMCLSVVGLMLFIIIDIIGKILLLIREGIPNGYAYLMKKAGIPISWLLATGSAFVFWRYFKEFNNSIALLGSDILIVVIAVVSFILGKAAIKAREKRFQKEKEDVEVVLNKKSA